MASHALHPLSFLCYGGAPVTWRAVLGLCASGWPLPTFGALNPTAAPVWRDGYLSFNTQLKGLLHLLLFFLALFVLYQLFYHIFRCGGL